MSKQIKQIPVNKTVVFWSPIEGEDVLVRTGIIKEGNSFYMLYYTRVQRICEYGEE